MYFDFSNILFVAHNSDWQTDERAYKMAFSYSTV